MDYISETLLVDWGRRIIDPNIWIHTLEQRLKHAKARNILLDDLTQPNEYHWLKFRRAFLICVLPPEETGRLNYLPFNSIIETVNNQECCKLAEQIQSYFST